MNQIEMQSRALELAIAKRIRQRRLELDWTLDGLSRITGLSKGHLSQVENGEKVPPISTLTKIAFGLGTSIASLITGESTTQNSSKIAVSKTGNRMRIAHAEAVPKSIYESFGFMKQDRLMDTYIITMGNEFPPNAMVHVGQEFVYTIEGIHEFYYDGTIYHLEAGEAVYFDSDRPHMGRSIGKQPTKLLAAFCNAPSGR